MILMKKKIIFITSIIQVIVTHYSAGAVRFGQLWLYVYQLSKLQNSIHFKIDLLLLYSLIFFIYVDKP